MAKGGGAPPFNAPQHEERDPEEHVPKDLKSKPKIPRTPAEGDARLRDRSQDVPQH